MRRPASNPGKQAVHSAVLLFLDPYITAPECCTHDNAPVQATSLKTKSPATHVDRMPCFPGRTPTPVSPEPRTIAPECCTPCVAPQAIPESRLCIPPCSCFYTHTPLRRNAAYATILKKRRPLLSRPPLQKRSRSHAVFSRTNPYAGVSGATHHCPGMLNTLRPHRELQATPQQCRQLSAHSPPL